MFEECYGYFSKLFMHNLLHLKVKIEIMLQFDDVGLVYFMQFQQKETGNFIK